MQHLYCSDHACRLGVVGHTRVPRTAGSAARGKPGSRTCCAEAVGACSRGRGRASGTQPSNSIIMMNSTASGTAKITDKAM